MANKIVEREFHDFKEEIQFAKKQIETIRNWAVKSRYWIDDRNDYLQNSLGEQLTEGGEAAIYNNGAYVVKTINIDYFIQPVYAPDRISLHNTYFPETKLQVLGFGASKKQEFQIIVQQSFIEGGPVSESEIKTAKEKLGFILLNPVNRTCQTPQIYISDVHDENVVKSSAGTFL